MHDEYKMCMACKKGNDARGRRVVTSNVGYIALGLFESHIRIVVIRLHHRHVILWTRDARPSIIISSKKFINSPRSRNKKILNVVHCFSVLDWEKKIVHIVNRFVCV